ncbi:hypothetical protein [Ferruginibacter sp.]|nr:hypothetical protein [Ferruginibacter sp.]
MANPTIQLVNALRETANRLRNGAQYSWGNHGACNCGNLIQVVTKFSKGEILSYAHTGIGEWTELSQEFCPGTNAPLSLIISKLQDIGLTPTDIHHIEYLTDREVLQQLPGGFRWLKRNSKEDAIVYFETFANLLEEKLVQHIKVDISTITRVNATNQKELVPA